MNHVTRPNSVLDRRTILCLHVSGFRRQSFEHVQKCKMIPLSKFQWISRRNTCNVNFVRKTILLPTPKQANIGSCSGFFKRKRIPQTYTISAYNLLNSLTICKFRLKFADCTYSSGFRDSLSLPNTYIILSSWILQTGSVFHAFYRGFGKFSFL